MKTKTVLVTGANKGIGFGIAKHLGLSGWQVIIGARNGQRAEKAINELKAQGIDVINHRYVFYSLGNFCFGGNMNISAKSGNASVRALETAAVRMELIFSDEGEYLGQRGRIYPCYASSSAGKAGDPNDFQPKPVTGEEARGVLERIQADTAFELGEMEEEGYVTLPLQSVSEEGGAP